MKKSKFMQSKIKKTKQISERQKQKILKEFSEKMSVQEDIPTEFSDMINKNFNDLIFY